MEKPQTWRTGLRYLLAGLNPGIYRIDVLADSEVVWRTFFRKEN